MARKPLTGSRIRRFRMDRGIRQAELARLCDISASYLNLIEHNRRRIGGGLLNRIAAALEIDPATLSEGAEAGLALALETATARFGDPARAGERSEDFAGRFPGWARVVARQQDRLAELERLVQTLEDRLSHDPFLSASLHSVLSSATSIRSASSILASGDPIEAEWQARFHRNILEDSQRLATSAQGLVTYLDAAGDTRQGMDLPQEALETWLAGQGWRIEAIERGEVGPGDIPALARGVGVEAAVGLAETYLRRYAADAAALGAAALHAAVDAQGLDPARIAGALGLSPALVMRRLVTLPAERFVGGLPPALVICDGSGTLTFRRPVRGFEPPRYGAACALWPLYQALLTPQMPIRTEIALRGRDEVRFTAHAIATLDYPTGFDGPPLAEATMLLVPGLRTGAEERGVRSVGTSCRVCAEATCPARREPSVLATAEAL